MTYFVVSTIALAFAVGWLAWQVYDLKRRMGWQEELPTKPRKRKRK